MSKSDRGWRWKMGKVATEADLRHAEEERGTNLPEDYRSFLATHGDVELLVRLPENSGELQFYRPASLETKRDNLLAFIVLGYGQAEAADYFRKTYGVSLRDPIPIAEPAQESRCLVIHLEKGERFGWCFHWDHDDPWELGNPTSSFDAALKLLTDGVERREETILSFLGV